MLHSVTQREAVSFASFEEQFVSDTEIVAAGGRGRVVGWGGGRTSRMLLSRSDPRRHACLGGGDKAAPGDRSGAQPVGLPTER